jgi:hypothetical protein
MVEHTGHIGAPDSVGIDALAERSSRDLHSLEIAANDRRDEYDDDPLIRDRGENRRNPTLLVHS